VGSHEQPGLMNERIQQLFPRLETTRFDMTSLADTRYNCVAWAAGDSRRWWWPGEVPFSYWPAGVHREESVGRFIEAFATMGYELTALGDHDPKYEKVAIFASADGLPTHMARQLADGSWTSKLGALEDIAHVDVSGVGGTDYGEVVAYLQRRRASSDAPNRIVDR